MATDRAREGRTRTSAGASKQEAERGALPGRALDPDRARVGLDDVLHDGEPQPGPPGVAGTLLVDAVETLEDPAEVLRGDADPVVLDAEADPASPRRGADADRPAAAVVLDGVVDEVHQDLLEPVPVPVRLGAVPRRLDDDAHPLPFGDRCHLLVHSPEELADVEEAEAHLHVAGFDARDLDEVVQEGAEVPGII